jgi:Ca2+-transporting ATPase
MKKSDGLLGLNDKQVLAKRKTHGLNELPSIKRAGPSRVLLRQFSNLLVLILIAAAAIAFALEEYIDAATIS